jgi:hypothetical protein
VREENFIREPSTLRASGNQLFLNLLFVLLGTKIYKHTFSVSISFYFQ